MDNGFGPRTQSIDHLRILGKDRIGMRRLPVHRSTDDRGHCVFEVGLSRCDRIEASQCLSDLGRLHVAATDLTLIAAVDDRVDPSLPVKHADGTVHRFAENSERNRLVRVWALATGDEVEHE